jgi:hypothetical protein
MVHFHIHTNGSTTEDRDGEKVVVKPIIVNAVWIGLGLLFWVTAVFLIVEAIRGIEKI